MGKTLIKTYKGCDIYYLTPPDAIAEVYESPCITGLFKKISAVETRIDALTPAPEPVVYTWTFIEIYRERAIFLLHPDETYWTAEAGVQYGPYNLAGVKAKIEELTGYVPPPEEFKCPYCGLVFPTQYGLDYHIAKFHPPEPPAPIFTCPECGVTFSTQDELDAHMEAVHPPEPEPPAPVDPEDEWINALNGFNIYQSGVDRTYYVLVEGVKHNGFTTFADATHYIIDVLGYDPGTPWTPPVDPPDVVPGEEAEQLNFIGRLMGKYGAPGPMVPDAGLGKLLTDPIGKLIDTLGLTPEAMETVMESPINREKAALMATSISTAARTGLGVLYALGIGTEIASLGQIDTVVDAIDHVLDGTGVSEVISPLFTAPFLPSLFTPTFQYWRSRFPSAIPVQADLITFVVREVLTPEEFKSWMLFHGFDSMWSDAYWESHWRLPAITDIIDAEHRGLITEDERDKYFVLHDYRPDPRPGVEISDVDIYGGLTKTILGRVDTRRAYRYGKKSRDDLIKMYRRQGYEEDSELQADIQIIASVDGLQAAIRREQGMTFRDRLKDARKDESGAVGDILADRNTKLVDLGNATIAGDYTEEEAAVIEADIRRDADIAIAEVRTKATAREEEVEALYRTALEEVKTMIDIEDLWVLRYKLAAARVEVPWEFEIEPPEIIEETPEEPE